MTTKQYYAASCVPMDDDILICAGDTETEGLGGKLLSVQWGMMGKVYISTAPTMVAEFFDVLLDWPKPAVWFFHFAQYDWRYFLDYIREQNLLVEICLRTETDIYEIRVRRTENDAWSIMRDSYALYSHKLKDLANSFCPEIPKLNIEIENFNPENPKHIEYAKRDVEILLKGLPRLFDMLREHFGVNPSATAAGTAMRAWQKTLGKNKHYDASRWGPIEQFIRDGYYGGLVFLTNNRINNDCVTYDINSSYPASMVEFGVPVGTPVYTTDYEENNPGIYRVRVRTPDDLIIPILPGRNIRGAMRWYRGEFDTTVTTQELQFAAENGYEILEIYEGYVFSGMEFPFQSVIEKCKSIRKEFKGKPEEYVAKLVQNSLYGKFASRRERVRVISSIMDDILGCIPLDESGYWYIKKELDEEMKCLPQWAVFITANSRLRLLRAAYSIGPENVIYADTDSMTVKHGCEGDLDIGDEYGQWKREKVWQVFRAVAPKVYAGILAEPYKKHEAGSFMGAAKGLPAKGIKDQQWSELLQDGATQASTLSLDSLKIAFKKGIRPARQLTRQSSTLNNSQNFIALPDGDIRVKYANGQNN